MRPVVRLLRNVGLGIAAIFVSLVAIGIVIGVVNAIRGKAPHPADPAPAIPGPPKQAPDPSPSPSPAERAMPQVPVDAAAQVDAAPDASVPVITATAEQIADEYHNNEPAAHAKYDGNAVRITGIIKRITGAADESVVWLRGGGAFRDIAVGIMAGENAVRPGMRVQIRCLGLGVSGALDVPSFGACLVERRWERSK